MADKIGLTIPELADRLGMSRVAVWTKVKKGQIRAAKVGRQYIISVQDARVVAGEELNAERKKWLADAVDRVVREYGPVLKRLSRE